MRETTIQFDRVRDCPYWVDGTCLNIEGTGKCNIDEIATPRSIILSDDVSFIEKTEYYARPILEVE